MGCLVLNYSSQELTEIPDEVIKISNVENLILDFNSIDFISPTICTSLSHLSCLSLNGNFFKNLPSEIDQISTLTELYMKENEIVKLPDNIGNLKLLEKLHLTGNQLQTFPESLVLLHSLSELIADENEIESLPSQFGSITSLKHLDLSNNKLKSLPDDFGNLKNLEDLNLSYNDLSSLPNGFENLCSLEIIDLTHNKIGILTEKLSSSKILKKFLFGYNQLVSLPLWFGELENIQEILLTCNNLQLNPFPEQFGEVSICLEYLDLSGNNITILPESFGNLKNLQYLDFGSAEDELERKRLMANGNSLTCLPPSFPNLFNLTNLQLDENEIKVLPDDFGSLQNITYLDLSHNILKALPDSFCQLKHMKVCMLSMNYLSRLPNDFGQLMELEDLKLDSNMLTELPASFECLTEIVDLDLYNNNFSEIPNSLTALKKLKHLDLRENDIALGLDELPEISYEPTYLKRKPEHSNNWRGRKRDDIQSCSWVDSKENDSVSGTDVLYQALKSSSQWRKHGQTSRPKVAKVNLAEAGIEENCKEEMNVPDNTSQGYFSSTQSMSQLTLMSEHDEDEQASAGNDSTKVLSCDSGNSGDSDCKEEFWDDDLLPISPDRSSSGSSSNYSDHVDDNADLSDWESDCIFECPRNFDKIYKHPVVEHPFAKSGIFVPSDIHPPRVQMAPIWYPIEEGQYDDADL